MLRRPIFRQKSIDKISSPEKIDELLEVTSPRSWLILISLILVIIIIIIWSIWGVITSKAEGTGIFNHPNHELTVHYNCQIDTLLVNVGDKVEKGQLLVRIIPEESISTITKFRSQLYNIRNSNKEYRTKQYNMISEELDNYLNEIEAKCLLTSPIEGVITEVKTNEDAFVKSNSTILIIQKWDKDPSNKVMLFVAEADISRIDHGMEIMVSIIGIKGNNQFSGRIISDPLFPASRELLMDVFNNEALVQGLIETKPYQIKGTIDIPPGMINEDINKNNGRVCQVEVITEKKRPIDLLFNR